MSLMGSLIFAFNFSSLGSAVLVLGLMAHLCWKRLLWTIPRSWKCHLGYAGGFTVFTFNFLYQRLQS